MCKKYLEKRTDTLILLQPNFPTKELIKKVGPTKSERSLLQKKTNHKRPLHYSPS